MSVGQSQTARTMRTLHSMIGSRVPVIGIESPEEDRVSRKILQVAGTGKFPKKVIFWSQTQGFHTLRENPNTPEPFVTAEDPEDPEPTTSPVVALRAILGRKDGGDPEGAASTQGVVYVFKDVHVWFANQYHEAEPVLMRTLRDLARVLIPTRKTVVLLSPSLTLPPDLEKDIHVLQFPLPEHDELVEIARKAAQEARNEQIVPVLTSDADIEAISEALEGLTQYECESILRRVMVINKEYSTRAIPLIVDEKRSIVRDSNLDMLATRAPDEAGGLDRFKRYVEQRRGADTPEGREFGLNPVLRVILIGPSGTGKSLISQTAGGGSKLVLGLNVGNLMGSLLGESEAKLRRALQRAEAVRGILRIDEVEKGFGGSRGGETDGGTSQRLMQYFLTWLQDHPGVDVIATANSLDGLTTEFLGRFRDVFFVDLPGPSARRQIVSIHLRKKGRDPGELDLALISRALRGHNGRAIEFIVEDALYLAWADGKRPVTTGDLVRAANERKPIGVTKRELIDRMRNTYGQEYPHATTPETEEVGGHGSIDGSPGASTSSMGSVEIE